MGVAEIALIDLVAPLEQEGTKATIRAWFKSPGERFEEGEALVELETDKVAVEIAAPSAGVLVEQLLAEGDEATPGSVLGRMSLGVELSLAAPTMLAAAPPADGPEPEPAEWPSWGPEMRLSPAVRRLLAESGIDPAGLIGTGRHGRLTRDDVSAEIDKRKVSASAVRTDMAAPSPSPQPAPRTSPMPIATGAAPGTSERVPHNGMRRRIAEHMSHSLATAPHVTAIFEADFSAIIAHRKANRAAFERQGVALTFTAYIVSACVQAMAAAPTVNSRWHDDFLEVFGDINIGVGTALGDKGLIVPVIHQANSLSLLGLATRLQDLTERARTGKLAPSDVQNGTFTISNHGVSGSLIATPIIINQPQSAILGVGKLEKRVVVREVGGADSIQIRPLAFVSLSIDHRVLDGAQTNAWLTRFVEVLETWPS